MFRGGDEVGLLVQGFCVDESFALVFQILSWCLCRHSDVVTVTLDMVGGEFVVRHCMNDDIDELAGPGAAGC